MKNFYILLIVGFIFSCNTLKKAEKQYNSGNYQSAFENMIGKFQKGVSEKNSAEYSALLQKTYAQNVLEYEKQIDFLKNENNPENLSKIYYNLVRLKENQDLLRPFIPIISNGQNPTIITKNYDNAILKVKNEWVDYLYLKSENTINSSQNKSEIRLAFNDLNKIDNELYPNYKNVKNLLNEAHRKGMYNILVKINNQTPIAIPRRLEAELLNFKAYDLDDFWTEYSSQMEQGKMYDYNFELDLQNIFISPERESIYETTNEKDIKDGWEYLIENGETVKDSLGNPIKVDKYKTIRAEIRQVTQEKEAAMNGTVIIIDNTSHKIIEEIPITSQFVFINEFANYRGNRNAIHDDFKRLLQNNAVPFPTSEQMIYDCGEDLKIQLKRILQQLRL